MWNKNADCHNRCVSHLSKTPQDFTFALSHSRTRALTHSCTHALMHSLVHSCTRALTHSCTHALVHSRTHALMHSNTDRVQTTHLQFLASFENQQIDHLQRGKGASDTNIISNRGVLKCRSNRQITPNKRKLLKYLAARCLCFKSTTGSYISP